MKSKDCYVVLKKDFENRMDIWEYEYNARKYLTDEELDHNPYSPYFPNGPMNSIEGFKLVTRENRPNANNSIKNTRWNNVNDYKRKQIATIESIEKPWFRVWSRKINGVKARGFSITGITYFLIVCYETEDRIIKIEYYLTPYTDEMSYETLENIKTGKIENIKPNFIIHL